MVSVQAESPPAKEDTMMEPTTSKTPKTEAATPAPGKTPKSVKKAKAPKDAKPKKEKVPKVPLVVFAFRLTEAQRDQIHKAAGAGKATRFVRSAALAAASGDKAALEELLAQAKANLK